MATFFTQSQRRVHRGFEPTTLVLAIRDLGRHVGRDCAILDFPAMYSRTQEKFINKGLLFGRSRLRRLTVRCMLIER